MRGQQVNSPDVSTASLPLAGSGPPSAAGLGSPAPPPPAPCPPAACSPPPRWRGCRGSAECRPGGGGEAADGGGQEAVEAAEGRFNLCMLLLQLSSSNTLCSYSLPRRFTLKRGGSARSSLTRMHSPISVAMLQCSTVGVNRTCGVGPGAAHQHLKWAAHLFIPLLRPAEHRPVHPRLP